MAKIRRPKAVRTLTLGGKNLPAIATNAILPENKGIPSAENIKAPLANPKESGNIMKTSGVRVYQYGFVRGMPGSHRGFPLANMPVLCDIASDE